MTQNLTTQVHAVTTDLVPVQWLFPPCEGEVGEVKIANTAAVFLGEPKTGQASFCELTMHRPISESNQSSWCANDGECPVQKVGEAGVKLTSSFAASLALFSFTHFSQKESDAASVPLDPKVSVSKWLLLRSRRIWCNSG